MAKVSKTKQASEILKLFREFLDFLEKHGNNLIRLSKKQYQKIKLRLQGKVFAVIGPKAAGKTTFLNILLDPNYVVDTMNYTPSQGAELLTKTHVIKYNIPLKNDSDIGSLKIKLRRPKDVGGEESYRNEGDWMQVCEDADYIFYILDAFQYDKNDKMKDRFKEDLSWIADNNQVFAPNFKIILFLNKMDKISEDNTERKEWAKKNIPIIESQIKNTLEAFENHFILAVPISMQSKINRSNAISQALLKVAES